MNGKKLVWLILLIVLMGATVAAAKPGRFANAPPQCLVTDGPTGTYGVYCTDNDIVKVIVKEDNIQCSVAWERTWANVVVTELRRNSRAENGFYLQWEVIDAAGNMTSGTYTNQ